MRIPSEIISIEFNPEAPNRIHSKFDRWFITITVQKSEKVGTRTFDLSEHLTKFIDWGCMYHTSNWLFRSYRECDKDADVPINRTDYTENLIKPITQELFGKAVSSRALRTCVISDKVGRMSTADRVDYARQCGHSFQTQLNQYAVLESPAAPKPKIRILPKKTNIAEQEQQEQHEQHEQQEQQEQQQIINLECGYFSANEISTEMMTLVNEVLKQHNHGDNSEFSYKDGKWCLHVEIGDNLSLAINLVKIFEFRPLPSA